MPEENQPQTTLRETLESNLDAIEQTGTSPAVEAPRDDRVRDDAGRFAPKPKEDAAVTTPVAPAVVAAPAPQAQAPQQLQRPTTWKKDYLPIWDKLANGVALNPEEAKKLAEYSNQRENEYKTGVSTYKAEAQAAKDLQEAITPFLPELQQNGIAPAAWVKQLGHAHYALAKGTPELKLQVFRELAKQFNVPLAAVAAQPNEVPPIVHALLGKIDQLEKQVTGVTSWRQQQETTSLTSEVDRFASDTAKYPHFPLVREQMAQLLELGLAHDLDTAYEKSVWMVPEAREAQQLASAQQTNRTAVVAKARAAAVSPRSATPSGQVATTGAKDRRTLLEEALDSQAGGRV